MRVPLPCGQPASSGLEARLPCTIDYCHNCPLASPPQMYINPIPWSHPCSMPIIGQGGCPAKCMDRFWSAAHGWASVCRQGPTASCPESRPCTGVHPATPRSCRSCRRRESRAVALEIAATLFVRVTQIRHCAPVVSPVHRGPPAQDRNVPQLVLPGACHARIVLLRQAGDPEGKQADMMYISSEIMACARSLSRRN